MMGMYTLTYHLWPYDWSLYFLTSFSSTPSGITCLYWKLYPSTCAKLNVNSHQVWYIRSTCLRFAKALWIATASLPSSISWQNMAARHPSRHQNPYRPRICWWHLVFDCIMGRWSDMWERRQNQNMKHTWNYILDTIPLLLDSSPLEKHGALVVRSDRCVAMNLNAYTPVAKASTQHNTTMSERIAHNIAHTKPGPVLLQNVGYLARWARFDGSFSLVSIHFGTVLHNPTIKYLVLQTTMTNGPEFLKNWMWPSATCVASNIQQL